jgi:hypothetical protein
MAHWRKRNPTAARFNAQLMRWALALSVFVGIILVCRYTDTFSAALARRGPQEQFGNARLRLAGV